MTLVCWAHLVRNVECLVIRGGDGTQIGVWARSLYRAHLADWSAFVEDRTSLRTYERRTRQMQSGFGELLTQGTGPADLRVRRMCKGIDSLWPTLRTYLDVPGVEPTNNGAACAIRPAVLPACRPVAQGEFRHAVREWCTVCRCHADGRGDLSGERPGPLRQPDRCLHRAHGRPYRPPPPPRLRLTPC
ncbi:MAG: hypothetical protein EBT09_08305 [Actinobacteria bacterium]|nr:hypothetical protein [Actinomycetota bacterium]